MEEFKLTNCQQNAITGFLENYKQRKHTAIAGPAGSGKSYLTKMLLDEMDKLGVRYVLCTPTHSAKNVLAAMSGRPVVTIHSLLKIHPETYEDQMEFKQSGKKPDLADYRLVVVDEASMIDDDLCDILMRSIHPHCVVLGIGDHKQFKPVKHASGRLSPFYREDGGFERLYLTEIVRNAGPIVEVATKIRQGNWISQNFNKEEKTGVLCAKTFPRMMDVFFKNVKTPDDLLKHRILAYTNETVNNINSIIRQRVYQTDVPFVAGEYLVMQEPVVMEEEYDGETITEILLNNGETVRVIEVIQKEFRIDLPLVNTETINGATLRVERIGEDSEPVEFNVLWSVDDEIALSDMLKKAAGEYRQVSRASAGNYWKRFWKYKSMFSQTKSLGCCTFHKSQGCTVDWVYLITNELNKVDAATAEEALYVGCTRPRFIVLYI